MFREIRKYQLWKHWRFANHPRFPYWALNMKQWHQLLSQSSVYLHHNPTDANLTVEELQSMGASMSAAQLMGRLQQYAAKIQGSLQYWFQQHQELQALLHDKGPPTFFRTVTSADNYILAWDAWPDATLRNTPNKTNACASHYQPSSHSRLVFYCQTVWLHRTVVVGSTWGRVALVPLWVLSKREHTCSWLCQAEKWSGHLFPSVESCFSMVDTRRITANWNYTHSWAGPHIVMWGRGHYTCAAVCWLAG